MSVYVEIDSYELVMEVLVMYELSNNYS